VQDELGLYLQPVKYNSGESLMVQDEVGEEMLFITSGVANVSINMGQGNAAKVVAQVATGKVVGEGALFDTNSKRSATVTATTEVRCFRLLYTDFHRIAPDALETLRLLYLRTILLKPTKNASDSSNKFNNMPVQLLNDLCRCATMKHYAKGEYIITEGDPVTNDSCLYIIRRGTVAFEKTFDVKEGKCPRRQSCSRYQYDLHPPQLIFCFFCFSWFVGLVRWFVGSLVLCFFLLRYTQVPKNWAKCLVVPSLGKVHC
jgi:CRP-like cAMP-binding protein